MRRTIVLGYDDSPSANAALAEVIRRAPLLGADVCVVFGYHMSAFGGPAFEGESTDFRSQLEKVGSRAIRPGGQRPRGGRNLDDLSHRGREAGRRAHGRREGARRRHRSSSARSARTRSAERCSARSSSSSCNAPPCRCSSSRRPRADRSRPTSSSSPVTTFGCTSPGWAGTAAARTSRSSSAATGAISGTPTASATSTRLRGSSPSTSATASARRSARRPSPRCGSCPSTPTGRTRIRARSSSPPRSRRSPPATSTASSSSPAAPRQSSPPGSWRASTTRRVARSRSRTAVREPERSHDALVAARGGPRRYKAIARHIAYHGTTMGALSINGIPAAPQHFRAARARRYGTSTTRTATTGRPRRPRRCSPGSCSTISSRRSLHSARRPSVSSTWSRCRTPAAASHRPPATGRAFARSATSTTSCSPPTR